MKCANACLLLCSFALLLAGCGPAGAKLPPTAKVSGTVTLDGKPMAGGEVHFTATGQLPKSVEVKDGAFSGEVFVGQNQVEVVWNKPAPPDPDPLRKDATVNVVDEKFSGPGSPLKQDIPASGASDLKFAVTSARK